MSTPKLLETLIGHWTGTSRLWRSWLPAEDQAHDSESTASVALAAQGKFATITYTWAVDDAPQEGLMLIGYEEEAQVVNAAWVDSWHMSEKFMICQGSMNSASIIDIRGSYSAPPGPDWGWRTIIEAGEPDSFRIEMYNISPDSQEELAFENHYTRLA